MEEQIFFEQIRSGTSLTYFSTQIVDDGEFDLYPAYLKINSIDGSALSVHLMEGSEKWERNLNNTFSLFNESQPYLTGSCFFTTTAQLLNEASRRILTKKFVDRMRDLTPDCQSFVLFENKPVNDIFVNVKLERSYDVLNTLNIYNRPQNEWPTQESLTGVVFGRLEAIQEILDSEGNKVRIPLRNVPIGIFNSSEEFPSIASTDYNGDRIRLNLSENTLATSRYFNEKTAVLDTSEQFSKSFSSGITQMPEQYKYITTTNQNGEFIIYDVPIGSRVLFFEVDLLKQGLTKDEVALNFFPYPTDESPNVDRVPHFFFRQIPVEVFPSWGDFQSGYTEVNVSANLDLRKWSTYYVPPVVYGPNGLQVNSFDILSTYTGPISLEIRDMTRMGDDGLFKNSQIRMVQVPNIIEKDETQVLMWEQEFAQVKNKANFYTHGWHAVKLPANLYDPLGYRTNADGVPREDIYHKGVWLSAYQMKLYFTDGSTYYRATGTVRRWNSANSEMRSRDHYHMNNSVNPRWADGATGAAQESSPHIGEFPYQKPWTIDYPVSYKIPAKPTQKNYVSNAGDTLRPFLDGMATLEVPYYSDGELIGENLYPVASTEGVDVGGLGLNQAPDDGGLQFINNNFSSNVTNSFVYKYDGVDYNDVYASGYNPGTNIGEFTSQILNAEKYQRVECGYGYTLWPGGMYRVGHHPLQMDMAFYNDIYLAKNDIMFSDNNISTNNTVHIPGEPDFSIIRPWYNLSFYVDNSSYREFSLRLDGGTQKTTQHDKLSLYRIIDPTSLSESIPLVDTQIVTFKLGKIWVQRGYTNRSSQCRHIPTGSANQDSFYSWDDSNYQVIGGRELANLTIKNNKQYKTTITINGYLFVIEAGAQINILESEIGGSFNDLTIEATTNYGLDYDSNTYTKCSIDIKLDRVKFMNPGGGTGSGAGGYWSHVIGINQNIEFLGGETYRAYSKIGNIRVSSNFLGTSFNCSGNHYQRKAVIWVDGIMCENSTSYTSFINWSTDSITVDCAPGGIPYNVDGWSP